MVIWLNGPFGVGKTTVARELAGLGAAIVDPERLGFVLRRLSPGRGSSRRPRSEPLAQVQLGEERAELDYQDLRAWRWGTIRLVRRAARRHDTVVVPMSVLHRPYVDELLAGARHVLLDASPATVRLRIEADTDDPAARGWRLAQLTRYEAARAELVAVPGTVVIDTDTMTAAQIAARVRAAVQGP